MFDWPTATVLLSIVFASVGVVFKVIPKRNGKCLAGISDSCKQHDERMRSMETIQAVQHESVSAVKDKIYELKEKIDRVDSRTEQLVNGLLK